MATMKDVAREAGVSTATISRYLHDSPNILPQTRELIEAAIEKLDYHPNHLARQFRTQRTGIILVLLPEIENSFFHKIIAGIESVVEKAGYRVMISEIHNKPENERYFFECLIQKQVDGIITFSARLEQEEVERLASSHPLVVACRKYKGSQIPNVTIDNEKASKDITNYILNLGHKKICYLAGDTKILLYQDRLKGFLDALRERKIEHSPSLLCTGLTTMQDGYDATLRLINSGESFTAVVASGDSTAIGAIQALRESKIRVPEDVAVVGFDDIELSSLFSPSLTTIRQPGGLIGVRSAQKLLNLIDNAEGIVYNEVLSYELIIRESSGQFIGDV